jgi:hypothetical protein
MRIQAFSKAAGSTGPCVDEIGLPTRVDEAHSWHRLEILTRMPESVPEQASPAAAFRDPSDFTQPKEAGKRLPAQRPP